MSVESCSNNFVATHAKNWKKTGVKSVLLIAFQTLMGQDRNSAIPRTIWAISVEVIHGCLHGEHPGGEGKGWALQRLSNVLNGDAPPRGPTTYPFMYRYPFRITSVKNGVPFIYLLKASLLFIIFQLAINKLK